jgi:hypothetical protein
MNCLFLHNRHINKVDSYKDANCFGMAFVREREDQRVTKI